MAKLVNFSEAASLGLHAMVLIAKSETHVNVSSIAGEMGASKNHLAKVLQQLVKHGFLKSVRGPSGGFVLSKPAKQISILDIYESIEGRIGFPECPLDRQICPFNKCLLSGLVTDVTMQFKKYFEEQTLEDFVTRT